MGIESRSSEPTPHSPTFQDQARTLLSSVPPEVVFTENPWSPEILTDVLTRVHSKYSELDGINEVFATMCNHHGELVLRLDAIENNPLGITGLHYDDLRIWGLNGPLNDMSEDILVLTRPEVHFNISITELTEVWQKRNNGDYPALGEAHLIYPLSTT